MNGIIVFTDTEFLVLVFFIIILAFIAIISSIGWYSQANKHEKRRNAIKDMFCIEYYLSLFGGTADYSNYIIEVEKNIKKEEQKKRKREYGKENLYCNRRRIF